MRTTLLNPTVWLLAGTCAAGVVGAVRGRTASAALDSLLRVACATPVLILLLALSAFGLGSRAVLGFLSPGAYAEEVVAARGFLEQRDLYGSAILPSQALGDPSIANLPWLSTCQGNAIANRARFYTDHAHPPTLLLAGVPVVFVGGSKLLYLLMLVGSLAAVAIMSGVLLDRAGLPWRSPAGLVVVAAVAGWQPILAGVRQGDAVLPAAGLLALTWHVAGRGGTSKGRVRVHPAWAAAIPSAVAACLAIPSIGVLPALWRTAPRAAAIGTILFLAAIATTVSLAGSAVIAGFAQTVLDTARTYAAAPVNYAIVGRALDAGATMPVLFVLSMLVFGFSWWRGTDVDGAFATFGVAGLMIAPVLWSQHLALLLIPFAVLFARTLRQDSALGLAFAAALALVFSFPDAIPIRLAHLTSSTSLIAFPVALVLTWLWTAFPLPGVRPSFARAPIDAQQVAMVNPPLR